MTCRTSQPTSRRLPPAPRRDGHGRASPATQPFIMKADGKGWLFVPDGLEGWPASDPLRAGRIAGANPLYGQQDEPGRANCDAPTTRCRRSADRAIPIVADHLPPDRAPPGGRDDAASSLGWPSCSRNVRRDRPRSCRARRASSMAAGSSSPPRAARSRPARW